MENVSVIAFYSFFRIDNLELLENQIQDYFQKILKNLNLKGFHNNP